MRLIRFILPAIILFIACSSLQANPPLYVWEWQFSIKNSSNQFISESISVYYYDSSSKKYIGCGGGTSLNYGNWGSGTWNAIANISGIDPDQPDATFTIPFYTEYVVKIGSQFVRIQNVGSADETFTYTGGSIGTQNYSVVASGTWADYSITLKNNFAGGGMYINSEWHSSIPLSGKTVLREASTFPHELTAVDGQTGSDSYKMLWRNWSDTYGSLSRELSTAGNYTGYRADFDKECQLTFQTNGKPFTADGVNYSSDQTLYKRSDNTFTATATNTNYNDVAYTFLYWKKDGSIVSNNITVSAHATYVAWYTAKPTVSTRNLSSSSQAGQNVTITWNVHPNANVTGYNIYRKVKVDGVVGPETFLTSYSSRYSTSYTDYEYTVTNDPGDDRLTYDVRPVYTDTQNNQVESDPYYIHIAFGIIEFSILEDKLAFSLSNEMPAEYSITNYPNPFNPTTTINYQLPGNGFVTIKVFDMLGKEITTLVNENKSAGYYKVNFDAGKLTSGVYIYTINANNFIQSKKMLLMK